MDSETLVRVAEIKLDNGKLFEVPRANLEMIIT